MSSFINTVDLIGDEALVADIIERSITELRDNISTKLCGSSLLSCYDLRIVDLRSVTTVGPQAFRKCTALTSVNLPSATIVGNTAFYGNTALTSVNLPSATSVGLSAFNGCTALSSIDLPSVTSLGSAVFQSCSSLKTVILRSDTIVTTDSTYLFYETPIASGSGYIYVPRALLSDDDETKDYRRATNWSTYASQFRAIEDYPKVCNPYEWSTVELTLNEGTYKEVYKIGDIVPLDLGDEGVIEMQIVAFDTDTLADGSGTAAITWVAKNLLETSHLMNSRKDAVVDESGDKYLEGTAAFGGWNHSELRSYLSTTIRPMLPVGLLNHLEAVSKTHYSQDPAPGLRRTMITDTSTDELWIPSGYEIIGTTECRPYADLPRYDVYLDTENYKKRRAITGAISHWWLRDIASTSTYTTGYWLYMKKEGKKGSAMLGSSLNICYICLGFCTGRTPQNTEE